MTKNKKTDYTSEFRKLRNKRVKGHPTYVYAKIGDRFEYIGITHGPITRGVKNIELDKNPNPKDVRKAYLRPKTESAPSKEFSKSLPNWSFSAYGKDKARGIIDNNRIKKEKGQKKKKGRCTET